MGTLSSHMSVQSCIGKTATHHIPKAKAYCISRLCLCWVVSAHAVWRKAPANLKRQCLCILCPDCNHTLVTMQQVSCDAHCAGNLPASITDVDATLHGKHTSTCAMSSNGCLQICRQDAAAATRKRLDDAAQLKAQEEQDKAAQRHQRQEYK